MTGTVRLSDTARHVLAAFLPGKELTRPDLGRETSLSKPTVSGAVAELEAAGLIGSVRSQQGPIGRAATVYGLAETAGWLLGLDVGSTRIRLTARRLDGQLLRHFSSATGDDGPTAQKELVRVASDQLEGWLAEFREYGPLRAAGIALPKIVPAGTGSGSTLSSPAGNVDVGELLAGLALPAGTPALLENNVNCAALAELTLGAAQGCDDFVYLQVGVGIGAGIVANRRLLRGSAGGAGEVAALPFPWAPELKSRSLALEKYIGSASLLRRARSGWPKGDGPKPRSVPDLFELAADGNTAAVAVIEQHAADVGNLATAIAAVLDPALIVLGGGVGQNSLLTDGIARVVHRYRDDIKVTVSALGDEATVEGAVVLTTEHALAELLGDRYNSRLDGRAATVAAP